MLIFKLNPLISTAYGTDGPHDGVGGGASVDGSPSGNGPSNSDRSGNDGPSYDPGDWTGWVDDKGNKYVGNEAVQDFMETAKVDGWEVAKAAFPEVAKTVVSAIGMNLLGTITGLKDTGTAIRENMRSQISEQVKSLIPGISDEAANNIAERTMDIKASGNTGYSGSNANNEGRADLDDAIETAIIGSNLTPNTENTTKTQTLNSNLKSKISNYSPGDQSSFVHDKYLTDNRWKTDEDWKKESLAGGVESPEWMASQGGSEQSGDSSTDQTGTDYKFDVNTRQAMTDFFNSFYDTALQEYQSKANQVKNAVSGQKTLLDGLIKDTRSGIDSYNDTVNSATTKQNTLLDGLINELEAGNNLNPLSFTAGGNTFSFIPKPNRNTASLISDLGQNRFSNSKTGADGVWDTLNTGNNSIADYGNKSLLGEMISAEENPTITYLDKLKELANMENAQIASDKGNAIQQQQVDQKEPGILDYLLVGGSLLGNW